MLPKGRTLNLSSLGLLRSPDISKRDIEEGYSARGCFHSLVLTLSVLVALQSPSAARYGFNCLLVGLVLLGGIAIAVSRRFGFNCLLVGLFLLGGLAFALSR